MKSPFALLTSLVLLSACGQTGPLYMPKVPTKAAPAAPAAASSAVQTFTPPAPAAGVTPAIGESNANSVEATNNQPATAPQQTK